VTVSTATSPTITFLPTELFRLCRVAYWFAADKLVPEPSGGKLQACGLSLLLCNIPQQPPYSFFTVSANRYVAQQPLVYGKLP